MTTSTKEKVQSTTSTAADEAASVAGSAKEEAAHVASEAVDQVKNLASEAATQVSEQVSEKAHSQRDHLAELLRTVGSDLDKMVSGQEAPGMAADFLRKASTHLTHAGDAIADKDPAELLTDVQSFARRKPGLFLAAAVGAGLVAGRVASGARQASNATPAAAPAPPPAPAPAAAATPPVTPLPVEPLVSSTPDDTGLGTPGEPVTRGSSVFATASDDKVPTSLESDFGDRGSRGDYS